MIGVGATIWLYSSKLYLDRWKSEGVLDGSLLKRICLGFPRRLQTNCYIITCTLGEFFAKSMILPRKDACLSCALSFLLF